MVPEKSTILKILAGIHQADEGEIYFHGKKVTIKSPEHSQKMELRWYSRN